MKYRKTFAVTSLCAAASLAGLAAFAQQQPAPQPPAQEQRANPAPQQDQAQRAPDLRGGNWGGSMMGRGMRNMSEGDRTAFFEARLAAVKAGLMLTEAQQALWPAVESAIREMTKQRQEWAQRLRTEQRPDNLADRMKRAGEMMSARGAAMTKFGDAMKPFHDSLNDEQKRRLALLMNPRGGQGRGMMGRRGDEDRRGMGMRGEHQQRWDNRGSRSWNDRGDRDWGERRWDRGGRGNDDHPYGRRWRQESPDSERGFGGRDGRRM